MGKAELMALHEIRDFRYHTGTGATFSIDVNGGLNLAIGPVPERGLIHGIYLWKTSGGQTVDCRLFSRDPAESDANDGARFDLTRDVSGGLIQVPVGATGEIELSSGNVGGAANFSGLPIPYDLMDDEFEASVLKYTASGQPTAGDTITLNGQIFTFVATAVQKRDVAIGVDFDTTYASLVTAYQTYGFEETLAYDAGTNVLSLTSPTTWSYDTHVQFIAVALDITDISQGLTVATHVTGKGRARFLYVKCDDPSGANLVGATLTIEDRE